MSNPFKALESTPNGLIRNWVAVTPNDSADNVGAAGDVAVGLYITVGGTVSWIDVDSNTVTVTVGSQVIIPGSFKRVRSTGTTATGIFALHSV